MKLGFSIGTICIFVGFLGFLGCASQPKHTGFEYECFEACERHPVNSLQDCVKQCTDKQIIPKQP